MRFSRPLLGSLLLATPALALAQTNPPPHFYVGLAAYASNYLPLGQFGRGGFPVPLQATAGYQWRPRLAVQVGIAYSGRGNTYGQVYTGQLGAGGGYSYSGQYRQRLATASLLGRYTLTRQAAHRWQFDALGGVALVHTTYHDTFTTTDSLANATTSDYTYRTNALLLNAGAGVRYRLGQHLEATYDLLLGVPLAGYAFRGISPSMALGLRYDFGRR